jgi:hypothetical protein
MPITLNEVFTTLLAERGNQPGEVSALASITREATATDYETLATAIDESDYSLTDWLEALFSFEHWLQAHAIPARPFASIIGYIHCCTLMNAKGIITPSLNIIVNKALIDYGFDATSPSQP